MEIPSAGFAPNRRSLIASSAAAGAGLLLGFHLPFRDAARAEQAPFMPNAFVRIATDSTVTVICKHLEFGQGVYTGLATLLADELDADWAQIRVESAPADLGRYRNLAWGLQGTGNSSSMANAAGQMRQAGAMARLLLVQAAALQWNVPPTEVTVTKGVVSHQPSGRHAPFGALAARAATLLVPWSVSLKPPSAFTLIGKPLRRIDARGKADGSARYAIDVKRPGMLTALIARPPRFGARVKSLDDSAAKAVRGVVAVVEGASGVAVLGNGFWPAKKGRDALKIEWDDATAEMRGTAEIRAEYEKLLQEPGAVARKQGDADAAIAGAARMLTADYVFPYLAHAPMEPLNCVVELSAGRCDVWCGSQIQTLDQGIAAQIAALPPDQVAIHTMLAGGSFGRRAVQTPVAEAVAIAKVLGGRAPVRVVWSREDDIRGGFYRPFFVHRLRAGLDVSGQIAGWHHRIVGQPLTMPVTAEAAAVASIVQGASTLPYAVVNLTVEAHATQVRVPVLWWRSAGSSHNAYAIETFIDDLAAAAAKDPIEFRLSLLHDQAATARVLTLAAEKAGWDRKPRPGLFRGVAVHEWAATHVAQIAEISFERGALKVERVVCAVDCGTPINPDIVKTQMEGGIAFGLGAVLQNAITLTEGRVDQSNFHDYPSLRIDAMPRIEVHIVPSDKPPTGVGEAAVPPIGPAVANAVFAATGKRVRALPFSLQKLHRS